MIEGVRAVCSANVHISPTDFGHKLAESAVKTSPQKSTDKNKHKEVDNMLPPGLTGFPNGWQWLRMVDA